MQADKSRIRTGAAAVAALFAATLAIDAMAQAGKATAKRAEQKPVAARMAAIPPLGPLPPVPVPADNPMSPAKVELGKMLFFDSRLGGDAS